jgi:hypothetical protein
VQESQLAEEFVWVFKSIQDAGRCDLLLNKRTPVSLQTAEFSPVAVKPYHSIMVRPVDGTMSKLNELHSDMTRLIELSSPFIPLYQLQRKLLWTWHKMVQMVLHLIRWRCAKLITTIGPESKFIATGPPSLEKLEKVSTAWRNHVSHNNLMPPSVNIIKIYERLSTACHLNALIKSDDQMKLILESAVFLLEQGMLRLTETFFYARIPNVSDKNAFDLLKDGSAVTADIVESVNRTQKSGHDPQLIKLLLLILPCCDGRTSLEEIVWSRRLSRKEVHKLLSTFNNILIPVTYASA